MKLSRIAALAPLLLAAAPVLAQGTAEQRSACMGDAWRLCKSDFTSVDAITACMKRERDKLGQACRAVLEKSEQETQQAANPVPPPAQAAPQQTAQVPAPELPQPAAPVIPVEAPKAAEAPAANGPAPTAAAPQAPAVSPVAKAPAPARPITTAGRRIPERAVALKPQPRVASAVARKPARQVAAARFAGDPEAREADQWMRRFGLGGLSRETVRDFRRVEAFFDGRL